MQFGLKDHVGDTLYISLAQMQTHSSHLTEREREREQNTDGVKPVIQRTQ
jgi:hypothetical protein